MFRETFLPKQKKIQMKSFDLSREQESAAGGGRGGGRGGGGNRLKT